MLGIRIGLLAAAGVLAFTSLASSADMAPLYKAPPPRAAAFSWTGFYIGAHAGGGWGTAEAAANRVDFAPGVIDNEGVTFDGFSVPVSQTQTNGFLGGATVGFNVQTTPWLVLGVEGDFSWTDVKGTAPCILIVACSVKHDWMATAAGRVGFTQDRLMVFFKGGVAWADTKYTASLNIGEFTLGPIQSGSSSVKNTRVGALFGTGIEYAFLSNWSAKIEYNYIDFGHHDYNFSIFEGDVVIGATIRERMHVVKGGVNWRFNTSGI